MTTLREHLAQFTANKGEEIENLADNSSEAIGGSWVKLFTDVPDSVLDVDDTGGGFGEEATRFLAWSKSYLIFFSYDTDTNKTCLGHLSRNHQTAMRN